MRKVLITGATSGFGKLLVEEFLKNGDTVIATGRNIHSRADIFRDTHSRYPGKLTEISLDVTNMNEIQEASGEVESRFGAIDILINNAGYGLFGALEDCTDKEIRYQMEVNFFGTVNVTKTFLPQLRKTRGKIFNFSSVFGFMGFPLTSLYCASKYAVEGLSESLRGELAPHGVQVCLIEPGGYRTNFGNSLTWSGASEPYKLQLANYKQLRQRLSNRSNPQNPTEVSSGILALSLKTRLPMRKVYGKDGRASHFMKRFLPSGIYFRMMDVFFKKIFLRSES